MMRKRTATMDVAQAENEIVKCVPKNFALRVRNAGNAHLRCYICCSNRLRIEIFI
jgi:hypothetical protein